MVLWNGGALVLVVETLVVVEVLVVEGLLGVGLVAVLDVERLLSAG